MEPKSEEIEEREAHFDRKYIEPEVYFTTAHEHSRWFLTLLRISCIFQWEVESKT